MASARKSSIKKTTARRRNAREVFREIGVALTSRLELNELLSAILEQVRALQDPSDMGLFLFDESCGELILYAEDADKCGAGFKIGEGIAGWVVQSGKSVLAKDGPAHSRYSSSVDLPAKRGAKAICCVPIMAGEEVRGAIQVLCKNITPTNRDALRTIADFAAVAIENSRYVSKIEELTITDDLTGLFNDRHLRRVLDMEIRRAERYQEEFSMIFIDLDRFKDVNDTYGHPVGSRVITEVGQILGKTLREDIDTAFRYGGDEFVMILPRTNTEGAKVVAGRVQSMLAKRQFTSDDNRRFNLTASFGIAAFPRDATTSEEILRLADEAMYEVKRKGRNNIIVYSSK